MRQEIRSPTTLLDVLDRVLDKGIVVDAHVRICVTGVHLLDVDARIVVASIATYLTYSDVLAATVLASSPPHAGGLAALAERDREATALGATESMLAPALGD